MRSTEASRRPGAETEAAVAAELDPRLEGYRPALTAYCYRMLGSPVDAEDAVQETVIRAWRGFDRFEGRSALGSWLHRIATNVCFDMLEGRKRRARPIDLGPAGTVESVLSTQPEDFWVEPIPDARVTAGDSGDPAVAVEANETVRLAFVAALQHLPPRQRAVLILRDVLRWKASEVAELLDTSVASVTSALQRARETLGDDALTADGPDERGLDAEHRELLDRYADAFRRYDIDELVTLLRDDATFSMPPYDLWLRGPAAVAAWLTGPGMGCAGSVLIEVRANGMPAFGQYLVSHEFDGHTPWGLQTFEVESGEITGICTFLGTERLFPLFGLPDRIPAAR